jgi:hypothetical protein
MAFDPTDPDSLLRARKALKAKERAEAHAFLHAIVDELGDEEVTVFCASALDELRRIICERRRGVR